MAKIRSISLLTLLSTVKRIIQIVLLLVLLLQVRNLLQRNLITSYQAITQATFPTPAPSPPTIISKDIPIDNSPVKGPSNAPITIILFSDFEYPYCQRAQRAVSQLLQQYKGQIRFVYHDFPLEGIHPHAFQAAIAARCAREQGRFWEMHDKLFENQYALATNDLLRYASELGLDLERFRSCMDSERYVEAVKQDIAIGQEFGVVAIPTFFINRHRIVGLRPLSTFEEVIDQELAR